MPNAPLKSLPKMDEQISVVWSASGSLLSRTWAHHIKFVAKERIELSLLRVGSDVDCTQATSRDLHSLNSSDSVCEISPRFDPHIAAERNGAGSNASVRNGRIDLRRIACAGELVVEMIGSSSRCAKAQAMFLLADLPELVSDYERHEITWMLARSVLLRLLGDHEVEEDMEGLSPELAARFAESLREDFGDEERARTGPWIDNTAGEPPNRDQIVASVRRWLEKQPG
jgi:hypothetical protein